MRLDSSGRLGLGTSSPTNLLHGALSSAITYDSTNINTLTHIIKVENTSTTASTASSLLFQSTGSGGSAVGAITLVNTGANAGALTFATRGGSSATPERMRIDSSGRVGIGTTTGTSKLTVADGSGSIGIDGGSISSTRTDGFYIQSDTYTRFYTSGAERARITSDGKLLVGTSSVSATSTIYAKGNSANTTSHAILGLARGNDPAGAGSYLGAIEFRNSSEGAFGEISCQTDGTTGSGDYPGRLVFSVTADGASSPTEAMRIKNSRIINIANTPTYADNAAAKAGGLVDGDVYRTSTGVLMIVYT
jgi:hypothetical protein